MLSARRCLWPVTDDVRATLRKELREGEEEDCRKWNRDFRTGRTLNPEGRIQWIEVPASEVPEYYREKLIRPVAMQANQVRASHQPNQDTQQRHNSNGDQANVTSSSTPDAHTDLCVQRTPLKQINCSKPNMDG